MSASVAASVSERARLGLDHFVASAARSSLSMSDNESTLLPADDSTPNEGDVIMLTVSSYLFRVLMFIHFDRDPGTRAHFAALAQVPPEEMNGERFIDTMMERGNLCCGALNRDLAQFFPHIGMSTPCVLKRSSVEHIAAVKPSWTRRYRTELTSGAAMHITIALCAFADLDFPFEPRAAAEEAETAGELEMF